MNTEWLPYASFVISLGGVYWAWHTLRVRTGTQIDLQLSRQVDAINEGFARSKVLGPLICCYMAEMKSHPGVEIVAERDQAKIVMLLHHVNYFASCYKYRKQLGSQWIKRDEWFKQLVLRWVEADPLYRWTVHYLRDRDDFQDAEYSVYFRDITKGISKP